MSQASLGPGHTIGPRATYPPDPPLIRCPQVEDVPCFSDVCCNYDLSLSRWWAVKDFFLVHGWQQRMKWNYSKVICKKIRTERSYQTMILPMFPLIFQICGRIKFPFATFYDNSSAFGRNIYARSKFSFVHSSQDLCARAQAHSLEGTWTSTESLLKRQNTNLALQLQQQPN